MNPMDLHYLAKDHERELIAVADHIREHDSARAARRPIRQLILMGMGNLLIATGTRLRKHCAKQTIKKPAYD